MNLILRTILISLCFIILGADSARAQQSVARQWSECQLNCIRKYFAKPTVHARHLSHVSIAMYDAWAAYDDEAQPYLLGQTWGGFNCPFNGIPMPADGNLQAAQEKAISYAAYRTLWNRYTIFAPGANLLTIQGYINNQMAALGYDPSITSTDYSDGDPAKLGNYIAAKLQEFALQDGSNQQLNYANNQYVPINGQLEPAFPGNPDVVDPNRWQSLVLGTCIDQNGIPIECPPGSGTPALSHEWGNVTPFALTQEQADTLQRDGLNWKVYLDPGPPPYLDTTVQSGLDDSFFKWGYVTNIIWHSFHNNDDGVMIDASPNNIGGLNITTEAQLPSTFEDYQTFYNMFEGGVNDPGHTINPATGQPYEVQMVPRKDFTRVLSQYWADGPSSETPPGHWFKLFNEVEDKMDLLGIEKRWMGEELVSSLEWDIKGYFALGGGIHDAAIACWGTKGYYDYTRPIMAIRWMGSKGQSTDPNLPSYHPAGLPLIPGYIELVGEGDELAGDNNEHINKIKVYSWRGPFAATGVDGAGWLLAENWWTYQTANFVTPPFAGYYSGHSTYSRTGAEIMTLITGDEYFPGGMAEFTANQDSYLLADSGPSTTVKLQWATYRDASDQCSVSRIYGGLHPPQDDIPGRKVGLIVGPQAVDKANQYIHADPAHVSIAFQQSIVSDINVETPWVVTATFDKDMDQNVTPLLVLTNTAASSSMQQTSGTWLNATTFEATFSMNDNNVTIGNVMISVQGAKDLNGISNLPGVSAAFAIDTQNPIATVQLIGAENILNEAAAAQGSSIDLLIDFSEEMNTSLNPLFNFPDAAAASSLVLNASSAWTSSTTYHAVLDLLDADFEATDIDIEISAATDIAGNAQLITMLVDAVSLDTDAPTVSMSLNQNTINDSNVGQMISITLTFDSQMNNAVNPVILMGGFDVAPNLVFADGQWTTQSTYTANYVILDGNTEASVNITITGAEDLAGNTQSNLITSDALSLDTENPTVISVIAADNLLNDIDASQLFELSIQFSEVMNGVAPPISLNPEIPSLIYDESSSYWNGNTYVAAYSLTDANEEISTIAVGITGGTDAAGNALNDLSFNADVFSIDTRNPQIASLTTSTALLNEGDVGFSTFAVTLNFDEAMDTDVQPQVTFNPSAVSLSFAPTSSWDSDFTYTAHYDVISGAAAISDIDIMVAGNATDAAGNPMAEMNFQDVFDIEIASRIAYALNYSEIGAYPNPITNSSDLHLVMPSGLDSARVFIFDGVGKVIADFSYTTGNSPIMISTSGWTEGMYLIRIVTNDTEGCLKVNVIR